MDSPVQGMRTATRLAWTKGSQSGHSASPARMEPPTRMAARGHLYGFYEGTRTGRPRLISS